MRIRAEALYVHDAHARIVSVNEPDGNIASRFFLARTPAGNLWRYRSDLPDDLTAQLEALCADEPVTAELSPTPAHREEYIRLLASHAPIEDVSAGPAYWFSEDAIPSAEPVAIGEANADLLRGGLDDWLVDVPDRHPFMAIIEEGHAVSVCASVRITDAAHEAGVETLPAHRRRGHAVNVVASWANAVQKMGAAALYSTSWDNLASRGVAAKLGLTMFGVDFHVR